MLYTTDADIHQVVHDFEKCQTGRDDFHHAQHLVVATYYLQSLTVEAATEKMHDALVTFLDYHQVDKQKYHETLTVFWLEMVALELTRLPVGATLVEKCNSVVAALNDPKLTSQFYSHEQLSSRDARSKFVAPDLRQWK